MAPSARPCSGSQWAEWLREGPVCGWKDVKAACAAAAGAAGGGGG